MKKIGQFFLTFVPLLLSIGIQLLSTFFLMGISALTGGIWYKATEHTTGGTLLTELSTLWSQTDFNTSIMLVYALCAMVTFGLWYYIKYSGSYLIKPKNAFHPLSLLGILMLVPGGQFLTTYIVNFTAALFPSWLEAYEKLIENAGLSGSLSVGMFFYSILIGPITEELIYRGVTLRQAKKYLPFWAANLMQAILFGVYHMNLMQGIYAFFIGLIFGYVSEKSGNIHSSILLHILFNMWGLLLSPYLTLGTSAFSAIFWFLFAIVMTTCGLTVFTAGSRQLKQQES